MRLGCGELLTEWTAKIDASVAPQRGSVCVIAGSILLTTIAKSQVTRTLWGRYFFRERFGSAAAKCRHHAVRLGPPPDVPSKLGR